MSDTCIDGVEYGPLACLIGCWTGDKGMDIAPTTSEPDGIEENPYYESIEFFASGDLDNAESQHLSMLRYHQVVKRKSNDQVFHDETGYWMWDAAEHCIMHSLAIPRAVCVLAGGSYDAADQKDGSTVLEVAATAGDADWGIVQSPFMRDNARTTSFSHRIEVSGNTLHYKETTMLDIYGKAFTHTDENTLIRS